MAEKTIVEKAGATVGIGLAVASDVANAIKAAIGTAATTVGEVLKKVPAKKAAKKAPAKKAAKKAVSKKAAKKSPAKKAAKGAAVKKTPAKKAAKKFVKKPANKAGRPRR
jgi:hypothetical protein